MARSMNAMDQRFILYRRRNGFYYLEDRQTKKQESRNWLIAPVLPRKQWPAVRYKEKRAITWQEHQTIVAIEPDPELQAFHETDY